jgi:hypothetical protein
MKRRRKEMPGLVPWRPFRELERLMSSWESRFPRFFEGFEEEEIMPLVESYVRRQSRGARRCAGSRP